MESLHTNRKSTCTQCNKSISVIHFAQHLQTHLPQVDRKKFKCSVELCSKIYYSQYGLKQHVKNCHSSTLRLKLKCHLCSKEYYKKSHLQEHVRSIHSGTKYVCSLCEAVFKSKHGRDNHVVATHTGEKAFPCELCPAKFSSARFLKSHQRVHSDERPHKCSICSKQFKQKTELRKHVQKVHSQRSKDFGCSTCQKTYYTKSDLSLHNKTHIGSDLSCYFCNKDFVIRHHLDTHLRTHTQEKPFFCPDKSCKYSCAHLNNLRSHQRCHHSANADQAIPSKFWTCYFCSNRYARSDELALHMRNHTLEQPFPCKLCKKLFKQGSNLSYHISSTHTKEKPYSCPHCQKCFSQGGDLRNHVAIHTGEKRFFCEFCSYASFTKSHFIRHLSTMRH